MKIIVACLNKLQSMWSFMSWLCLNLLLLQQRTTELELNWIVKIILLPASHDRCNVMPLSFIETLGMRTLCLNNWNIPMIWIITSTWNLILVKFLKIFRVVEWLWSFILQLKSSNFQLEPLLHHLYVNL